MKRFVLPISLILLFAGASLLIPPETAFSATEWAQNEALSINSITNTKKVGLFERFEIAIDLSATFDNPFDPDQIDITAYFTSPSGKNIAMPGFFFQDYTPSVKGGRERLILQVPSQWKVRFAPLEIGEYKYYIVVRDKNQKLKSDIRTFEVVNSSNPGFLRPSKTASHYLMFDSGKQFFGVGESIGWAWHPKKNYEYYFSKLAENGGNISRIWMVPWHLALEWTNKGNKRGHFKGLGIYNLEHAWYIDKILDIAKEKGIYFMLTMGSYSDLMVEQGPWNEQSWINNPYNEVNGGFCGNPEEFFTNKEAKNYYKKRLRYIIARWGYATNLLSLEFLNEYKAPVDWVKEMGKFIKETDPSHHMVTISIWYPGNKKYDEDKLWNLDEIDFTQIHLYGYQGVPIDLIGKLTKEINKKVPSYPKPCLVSEFGIDSAKDDRFYDHLGKGVNLHNGLWTAVFSGSFAGAMNWWWDSYVDPKNLYYHYQALANFVTTVDWIKGNWENVKTTQPKKDFKVNEKFLSSDLVLSPTGEWGQTDGKELTITNTGEISGGEINKYLHSPGKGKIRLTPLFNLNYPEDGQFILTVGMVSSYANLRAYIDGEKVWEKKFPTGAEGKGEWEKTKFQKKWGIWQSTYNKDYAFNVPKGKHIIKLENAGSDWAIIKKIKLTNYKNSAYPTVRVIGLRRQDEALLWIHNIDSNWYTNSLDKEPITQDNFNFNILELPNGTYSLEWWNTWEGKIVKETEQTATDGKLPVHIQELKTDIAIKIRKK